MILQVLVGVGAAVAFAIAGYYLGTAIRGRTLWYRVAFIAIVLAAAAVIAWALVAGAQLVAAGAIGAGFGLLNGVRHGFTRPFAGLSGDGSETAAS